MSKHEDIISILDTINKENAVSVYIPSLKKEVSFNKITTGQQKNFLKATIDNPVFQTRFIIAAHDLIHENCNDKTILKNLTSFDSNAILLQLRLATFGDDYEVVSNSQNYSIKISALVENFKQLALPDNTTVEDSPFTIVVGVPLFEDQFNLEKQLRERGLAENQGLNPNIGETIGDAFIGEISKYIKSIKVKVGEVVHDVDYASLSFTKKHAILEKLSPNIVKSIIAQIETVTTLQKQVLSTTGKLDDTEQLVSVTLNPSLFAVG